MRRCSIPFALLLAGCVSESTPDTGPDEGSGAASTSAAGTTEGETGSGPDAESGSSSGASTGGDPETGSEEGSGSGGQSTGPATTTGADCDPQGGGTLYAERDYEVEDPEELFVEPVGYSTYLEGECWDGSNCWQVNPIGTAGNEDHAGWGTAMLPPLAEGGTQTMFVGHLFYVSSGMIDVMVNDGVSGKMLDGSQHDLPDGGGPTRQTVIWSYWNPEHPGPEYVDTAASGVVPRLLKGGAGGNYVRQIGEVQFDLRDYADQWIWLEFEFNAAERYTAMWVKTQDGVFSGANCEPIMRRSADDPQEWVHEYWVEEPYEYVDEGWATPGLAWGYWDDLENKPLGEDDFVRIDHLVVSDAWITPPF